MPRGPRKTQSGAPAQSGPGIPGQTYGHGVEAQALEAVAPTPNFQAAQAPQGAPGGVPVGVPGGVPGGGPPVAPPQPGQPDKSARFQRALEAAQGMQGQMGSLTRPTDRPSEPLMTGVDMGPGPGSEAMVRPPSQMGRLLRDLTMKTGNPRWADMAQKAGMR
jgi:hypothetical protein